MWLSSLPCLTIAKVREHLSLATEMSLKVRLYSSDNCGCPHCPSPFSRRLKNGIEEHESRYFISTVCRVLSHHKVPPVNVIARQHNLEASHLNGSLHPCLHRPTGGQNSPMKMALSTSSRSLLNTLTRR